MALVVWAEPALRDLEAIAEYVALDDPKSAQRLVSRVFDKTDQLSVFPNSRSEPKGLKATPHRRLIMKPILLYYRVEDDVSNIVHVTKEERKFDLSRIERNV